jgi:hypothetical protein
MTHNQISSKVLLESEGPLSAHEKDSSVEN